MPFCLFDPPSQQTPDFYNHATHMFILTEVKPTPLVNQAQINSDFIQTGIRLAQMAQANLAIVGLRFQ